MKNLLLLLILLATFTASAQEKLEGVFPFSLDQKNWGVLNAKREIVLAPQYKRMEFFSYHEEAKAFAVVLSQTNKYGIIDREGKEIIAPSYDFISSLENNHNNTVRAKKNGKMGLIDALTNKVIVPFDYDEISFFRGTEIAVAVMKKDGKYGALNSEGKIIAAPLYQHVFFETKGARPEMLLVDENERAKLIDAEGKLLKASLSMGQLDTDKEEEDYEGFRKYFVQSAKVGEKEHTKILLKHPKLKQTTEVFYNRPEKIVYVDVYIDEKEQKPDYNYIVAVKNEKYGIIGKDETVLTPFEYDRFNKERNKMIMLYKDQLKACADKNGRLIHDAVFSRIQFLYDPKYEYLEGQYFFIGRPDGAYGYADMDGNVFLPN